MYIKRKKLFKLLSIQVASLICLSSFTSAQVHQINDEKASKLDISYLESKNELKDYILDTGDRLYIKFVNSPDLSGLFTIDEQGEIYFERIKYTYVRGLTIKELTQLLEKRFEEFLIIPNISITISTYKPIRVAIKGEVRSPGIITFPSYISSNEPRIISNTINSTSNLNSTNNSKLLNSILSAQKTNENDTISSNEIVKRNNDYITTLSNAIQGSGGLTSYSDISNIQIVRDIPIGKGGGKKRAMINFLSYINSTDPKNDIRLFDGDTIFVPRLKTKDPTIVPNSILTGLSPKFINVSISGQIENPGVFQIPIEGSLSDIMNLSGPRKPLSGKVYLIRYNKDGTLTRKNINYSTRSTPGSDQNPYLVKGDLISVKNSLFGRTSGIIKAVTAPFVGIYSTKEIITDISN